MTGERTAYSRRKEKPYRNQDTTPPTPGKQPTAILSRVLTTSAVRIWTSDNGVYVAERKASKFTISWRLRTDWSCRKRAWQLCPLLVVSCRGRWKHLAKRHKTLILWERSDRMRSLGSHPSGLLLRASERNKIYVFLSFKGWGRGGYPIPHIQGSWTTEYWGGRGYQNICSTAYAKNGVQILVISW